MVVTFDSDSEQKPQRKHLSSGSVSKIDNSRLRNRGISVSAKHPGKFDNSTIGDSKRDGDAINFLMKYADGGQERKFDREREMERRKETMTERQRDRCEDMERDGDEDEETVSEVRQKKLKRSMSLKGSKYKSFGDDDDDLELGKELKHTNTYDDWVKTKAKKEDKSAWNVTEQDIATYRRRKNYYPPKKEEPSSSSIYTSKNLYITAASLLAAGVTVAIFKNKFFT